MPEGKKQVHLYHIRKTGGTSLFNSFLSLGGEDPRSVLSRITAGYPGFAYSGGYTFSESFRPNSFVPIFFSFSHWSEWQVKAPQDTYKVTVLRDPVARVVSLYRYLTDDVADALEVHGAEQSEKAMAKRGFDSFLANLSSGELLHQVYMFSQRLDVAEAAGCIRSLDCYFFTEHYLEGIQALSQRLGLALPVRHDRLSTTPATSVRRDLLRELLAPEYEMLRLLMEDPGPGFVGAFPQAVVDFAESGSREGARRNGEGPTPERDRCP